MAVEAPLNVKSVVFRHFKLHTLIYKIAPGLYYIVALTAILRQEKIKKAGW
jgi:hypothetical protein